MDFLMTEFLDLFSNYILMSALAAWLLAQILKVIIYGVQNRTINLERLIGAGGMPSSHTATVVALTVAVGRLEGLGSPLFAIAFILACVVMYDATGVRRAAGEQAKVLNKLMFEHKKDDPPIDAEKALKEFLGHTPLEVFGGAILGIIVAFLIPMSI